MTPPTTKQEAYFGGPNSFVLPLVIDPAKMSRSEYALYLSVLHHGLAAMSSAGVPSSRNTVMQTADEFKKYLNRNNG